ncbi:hypothetical protein G6717_06115 [Polynucleobacter paneuropaeus]|nr:hypothetical protein [Polynucleobacter paneuropaeus]
MTKKITLTLDERRIPSALVYTQALCFALLYGIWALPQTILVRNICLILGAVIGLYQIYAYRKLFKLSENFPILLLLALFGWMTFHLFFLGDNYAMQLEEYKSVWKRSFLVLIFAFGFGLSIAKSESKVQKLSWIIFYLGLMMPIFIYLLKFTLTQLGRIYEFDAPAYWTLYQSNGSSSPYYIAKTAYMGFCAPVLAISMGQLYVQLKKGLWVNLWNLVYLVNIFTIFFIFYKENVKNGILYGFIFTLIFLGLISFKTFKVVPIKTGIFILLVISFCGIFVGKHVEENRSWQTLYADAKIAIQTDRYQNWKYGDDMGYPLNEYGERVSVTNYERIAWFFTASRLVAQYPLGYGLIERSFRQRGNQLWPGSRLSQSHSGWLDLSLGIGVPGILLILGVLLMNLKALSQVKAREEFLETWATMAFWALLCFLLIWCTTEISQKVFFEELIFFLALAAGLMLGFSGAGRATQLNMKLKI